MYLQILYIFQYVLRENVCVHVHVYVYLYVCVSMHRESSASLLWN